MWLDRTVLVASAGADTFTVSNFAGEASVNGGIGGDRIVCARRGDVPFLVGGQDRSRFVFTGLPPPAELARVFAATDLHVYPRVPFVLSWSVLNALACGATVLASDTAPVREVVEAQRRIV